MNVSRGRPEEGRSNKLAGTIMPRARLYVLCLLVAFSPLKCCTYEDARAQEPVYRMTVMAGSGGLPEHRVHGPGRGPCGIHSRAIELPLDRPDRHMGVGRAPGPDPDAQVVVESAKPGLRGLQLSKEDKDAFILRFVPQPETGK